MSSLEQQLSSGIAQQSLAIDESQQQKLIQFVHLLSQWNKVFNLTSINDKKDMVTRHLLDSLVVLPFFTENSKSIKTVLDVGTGGGIPGIPLAICLPDMHFVLLDSRGKKVRFIQTAIVKLGLKNVTAVHSRVEDYSIKEDIITQNFDRVISRAFASLADMVNVCQHLCDKNGRFLAMKGQILEEEIAQLPEGYRIEEINELEVPGLNAQRHLIQIVSQS